MVKLTFKLCYNGRSHSTKGVIISDPLIVSNIRKLVEINQTENALEKAFKLVVSRRFPDEFNTFLDNPIKGDVFFETEDDIHQLVFRVNVIDPTFLSSYLTKIRGWYSNAMFIEDMIEEVTPLLYRQLAKYNLIEKEVALENKTLSVAFMVRKGGKYVYDKIADIVVPALYIDSSLRRGGKSSITHHRIHYLFDKALERASNLTVCKYLRLDGLGIRRITEGELNYIIYMDSSRRIDKGFKFDFDLESNRFKLFNAFKLTIEKDVKTFKEEVTKDLPLIRDKVEDSVNDEVMSETVLEIPSHEGVDGDENEKVTTSYRRLIKIVFHRHLEDIVDVTQLFDFTTLCIKKLLISPEEFNKFLFDHYNDLLASANDEKERMVIINRIKDALDKITIHISDRAVIQPHE